MPENISYSPDQTQVESDALAIEQQLDTQELPALPEERYARFTASMAKRFVGKADTSIVGEKKLDDLIYQYGGKPTEPLDASRPQEGVTQPEIQPKTEYQPVSAQKEALDLEQSDLSQFDTTDSWQLNFKTLETPDEVNSVIAAMAEKNKSQITEARRGVVGDEQLRGLASDLGKSPEFIKEVLEREQGGIFSPEKMLAARQVIEQSATKLKELSLKYKEDTTSELRKAEFLRQFHFHQAFQAQFMGARAEYGRGLRALGVKSGDSMEVENVATLVTQMERGLSVDKIADQIAMADTTRMINGTVESMQPSVLKKVFDVGYEIYINSILSGIKTHIVNNTGSALRLGLDTMDTKVASFMGHGGAEAVDIITRDEWKAKLYGEMSGFQEAWKVMWQVMKTGDAYSGIGINPDSSGRAEFTDRKNLTAEALGLDKDSVFGGLIDFTGHVLRAPTERLMGGSDSFWRKLSERGSLAQLAYRHAAHIAERDNLTGDEAGRVLQDLMENPTPEMVQQATDLAQAVTFQTPLGKKGQSFQKLVHRVPGLRYVFPFVKTPMNLLKQGYLERTPFGMLSKSYKEEIAAGGSRAQMARSKMLTGTGMLTAAWFMAQNGQLTGSEPADRDVAKKRKEAGWRPRSFVFENPDGTKTYVSLDRMEPLSYILFATVDLHEYMESTQYTVLGEEEEKRAERMLDALVIAAAENTLDKTFMTGMRDIMNVWTDPHRYREGFIKNKFNAQMPFAGTRRDVFRLLDDKKRRATEGYMDFFAKEIFNLKENAPVILDSYGEEVEYDTVLSPWAVATETRDPLKLEVGRLAETTKRSALPELGKLYNGVRLDPKTYYRIKKLARKDLTVDGNSMMDELQEFFNSTGYEDLIDDDKVTFMNDIVHKYDDAARKIILEEDPELYEKVMSRKLHRAAKYEAKETGESEDDALERLKSFYLK